MNSQKKFWINKVNLNMNNLFQKRTMMMRLKKKLNSRLKKVRSQKFLRELREEEAVKSPPNPLILKKVSLLPGCQRENKKTNHQNRLKKMRIFSWKILSRYHHLAEDKPVQEQRPIPRRSQLRHLHPMTKRRRKVKRKKRLSHREKPEAELKRHLLLQKERLPKIRKKVNNQLLKRRRLKKLLPMQQ